MPTPRFLTLDDVAEILNVSWSQAYAIGWRAGGASALPT